MSKDFACAFHDAFSLKVWMAIFSCNPFLIEHSFSCPREGFPIIRHEIRDVSTNLLSKVCHVNIEPGLQPLTGEVFS